MSQDKLREIVPSWDNCAALKTLGFPQDSALVYVDGFRHTVEINDFAIKTGTRLWLAAPTASEFQAVLPPRFFVMAAGNKFMFIDAMKTTMKEVPGKGVVEKAAGIVFNMIPEALADSAANCWAKGTIYLLATGAIQLKGTSDVKSTEAGNIGGGTEGLGESNDGKRP